MVAAPPGVVAQRIVDIARGELARGVREVPAGSDRGPRIRTYVRSTRPSSYPNPWCAYFVSWVTRQAGVPIGPHGTGIGSVAGIALWARRTGRWHHTPRLADVMVLADHVGIVVRVTPTHFVSIDGNYSDRVKRVDHRWGEAVGFARVVPRQAPDPPLHARFTSSPGPVAPAGTLVRFSARPSRGDIARYAWDLDGDGRFDDAHGPVARRAYATPGAYRVALRVTSRGHHVSVKHHTLTITVAPPAPQPASR